MILLYIVLIVINLLLAAASLPGVLEANYMNIAAFGISCAAAGFILNFAVVRR